jgi:peptidoglycan/LPS O-acetylase OafA/YrhL
MKAPFQALFVTLSFFFFIQATVELEKSGKLRAALLAPMVRLGKISYSVYLVHEVAFVVSKRLLVAVGSPAPLTLVLRGAAGIAAGYVLFRLVEEPVLRFAQGIPVPLIRAGAPSAASSAESV